MNTKQLISDFRKIQELGFIPSTRPNNRDGGIGNTLEDLLGVKENNLKEADYLGFEIKSQRQLTISKVSLFSKAPTYPDGANAFLKDRFGEIRDNSGHKKLYASIFGHRDTLVYKKHNMSMVVDRELKRVWLLVICENGDRYRDVYWSFDELFEASHKLKCLMFVSAKTKRDAGVTYYYYQSAQLFYDFDFDSFINLIEIGDIQFDLRIGSYKSGRNIGKPHDHGSGFRINGKKIHLLYKSHELIENKTL